MKKKSQHFCMKKTKISSINCVCNVHSFTYLILWSLMILQRKNNTIQAFYSNYIMICIKKISCRWLAHRQNTHSMKKCIQRMLACARKNLFRCCIFFFVHSVSLCPLKPKFLSAAYGQILFDGPTCVQCAADVFN